jgi:hypothetical protein
MPIDPFFDRGCSGGMLGVGGRGLDGGTLGNRTVVAGTWGGTRMGGDGSDTRFATG